jgi:molybdenum-dependent DNA-binding transcriptional regulator ModE
MLPLTPFGLSLVARYRKIERSAESAAQKSFGPCGLTSALAERAELSG